MAQKSYYNTLMSNLDSINSVTELDEEQVLKIKEKFKQVENSLRGKIKPKTITISGPSHTKVREYCSLINENIGEWCDKILINYITENPPIITLKDAINNYYNRENLPEFIKCLIADPLPYTLVSEDERRKNLIKEYSYSYPKKLSNTSVPFTVYDLAEIKDYKGGANDYCIYNGGIYLK